MHTYIYIFHLQYTTFISYPEASRHQQPSTGTVPITSYRSFLFAETPPYQLFSSKKSREKTLCFLDEILGIHESIINNKHCWQLLNIFKTWIHPVLLQWNLSMGKSYPPQTPTFLESFSLLAAWNGLCPTLDAQKSSQKNIRKSRREMSSLLPFLEFSEMKSSCPFWVFPKIVGFPTPIFGKHPYHLWNYHYKTPWNHWGKIVTR